MPVMPFEGLLPEDETAIYGEPVETVDPETVPDPADAEWFASFVLSGAEAEFAEAHADWHHGSMTEGQARFWNGSL